jgi:glycosyltransferase involved in cell wall biosynthesis
MSNRPLISCIVPVYNGERYLAEALDSILAQTYRPLEILVVDDGSTDRTPEVIAGYGSAVRTLHQPNAGPAAARNRGITVASGAFLAFLDADDRWHPAKLERQMARFAARPELDYSVVQVRNFWVHELDQEQRRFHNHRRSTALPGYVCQTLLARRDVFERVGPFGLEWRHADHTDWFLRAAERGALGELLREVLVFRRLHPSSLSRRLKLDSQDEYLTLLKGVLDRRRRETRSSHPSVPTLQ